MNPLQVIERAKEQGVYLWRDGDDLAYEAPPAVMTDKVKTWLRVWKSRVLPLLPDAPPSEDSGAEHSAPYPRLEGNRLPPDQYETARTWIQKRAVDDPNPLPENEVAELQSLLTGFPEGLYREVVWAEWDGKRHKIFCAGWPAPVTTEIAGEAEAALAPYADLLDAADRNALPPANWFLPSWTGNPGCNYGAPIDDPNGAARWFAHCYREAIRRGDQKGVRESLECLESVKFATDMMGKKRPEVGA